MILTLFRKISLPNLHRKYPLICTQFSSKENTSQKFEVVYKLPIIKHISVFNRLKIYQIAATLTGVPASLVLASGGIIDPNIPIATTCLGAGITAFLCSISVVTNKFIGFIYLNQNQDIVKVSYVDFWGKRHDDLIPIDDIIPFFKVTKNSIGDYLYKPFQRYSRKGILKMNLQLGHITDIQKFNKIFIL